MKKKENKIVNSGNSRVRDEVEAKIQILQKILNNVYEIMVIFKPLLEKMLKMEDAQLLKDEGSITKAANLFGEISRYSEILTGAPFSPSFLKNIKN